MSDITLTGPYLPARSGVAKHLIVLLHGYGADGNDLISLAAPIAEQIPDAAFASPHAPFPCEMGFGRQWFSLADRHPLAMQAAITPVIPILNDYLDQQTMPGKIVLVGFSQGTMMALAAGLRRPVPLGGIAGFSGMLLTGDLAQAIQSRPPVLLVHGDRDEVVPFLALERAVAALSALDVPVESLTRPGLGHGIDPVGMEAALAFIRKILGS